MQYFELEECQRWELASALVLHSLLWHDQRRLPCLLSAYWTEPYSYFEEMEREVAALLGAAGVSQGAAFEALDAFVANQPVRRDAKRGCTAASPISAHLEALLLGYSRTRLERMCARLPDLHIGTGAVLIAGEANGRVAATVLGQSSACTAMLLDTDAFAVRVRGGYLERRGWSHRAVARQGALTAIPAPDRTFQAAFIVQESAAELPASMTELVRVVKPGGFLSLSLPMDPDVKPGAAKEALRRQLSQFSIETVRLEVVSPDSGLDAITDWEPEFTGCLNVTLRCVHGSAAEARSPAFGRMGLGVC